MYVLLTLKASIIIFQHLLLFFGEGTEKHMSNKFAVIVASVIGLIAVVTPIVLSVYWAWAQSLSQQMRAVGYIADDMLQRTEASTDQVFEIFDAMKNAEGKDPCSDQNIALMGKLNLESEQVQAVGYVENNLLLCSSYGRHNTPVGPPTYETPYGLQSRIGVQFPISPNYNFVLSTDAETGYSVAIHPNQPLAIFIDKSDVSVGIFSTFANRILLHRGDFKLKWMDSLGKEFSSEFVMDDRIVAVRHSKKYAYATFAAIPTSRTEEGLRDTALLLVPFGILAGIALALAVFYVANQQLSLPSILRNALKRREFFLVYQPIIDLRNGKCAGAEALIRWRRPNGEIISPDAFIPVAEQTGLIRLVTKRVLELVEQESTRLLKERPNLHIAVNLSADDLHSIETGNILRSMIQRMGIRPHNIIVEATERGIMDVKVAREVIKGIRDLDVKIAIDDFGTGYSSLSYLETFQLDYLKIDKSFVDTMSRDAVTSQVVHHVIEMAKSLDLEMIAEGVETKEQLNYLSEHGVQYAQGWYFAKPMPMAQFINYLEGKDKIQN